MSRKDLEDALVVLADYPLLSLEETHVHCPKDSDEGDMYLHFKVLPVNRGVPPETRAFLDALEKVLNNAIYFKPKEITS